MSRCVPVYRMLAVLFFMFLVGNAALAQDQEQGDAFSTLTGSQTTRPGAEPATYDPDTIARVNPLPSEANGAWELSGPSGTFTGNGYQSFVVSPGTYTVRWLPTPGWSLPDPATQTQYIGYASSYTFTGTFPPYSGPAGTLTIDPEPGELDAGWELQTPDGLLIVGTGGQSYEHMPIGTYTLTWLPLEGYLMPDPQTVAVLVEEDSTAMAVGEYTLAPVGTVMVDPQPSGLMAPWHLLGPESYSLEGEGFQVMAGLVAESDYILVWGEVNGFFTPSPDTLYLEVGGLASFSTTYDPLPTVFGTVTVESGPEYYPHRYWTLSGPDAYFFSGVGDTTLTYLPTGDYSLVWQYHESSWVRPTPTTNNFVLFDQNHVTVSGVFAPITYGDISIDGYWETELLSAHWTLSGPDDVFVSGYGHEWLTYMPVGEYVLIWADEPGFIKARPDTVEFELDGSIGGENLYHPYARAARLTVSPSPHALNPPWRVVPSDTNYAVIEGAGASVIEGLYPGDYQLEWLSLADWQSPSPVLEDIHLLSGSDRTVRGEYSGIDAVVIDVLPPGLDAHWALSGPDTLTWSGSGDQVLTDMEWGSYQITFTPVTGYSSPDPLSWSRTLYIDSSVVFKGEYDLDFPDLALGITPYGRYVTCPGQVGFIEQRFANIGLAPATGSITSRWYLSRDSRPGDLDDIELVSSTRAGSWEPGESWVDTVSYSLPDDIQNAYYYMYYQVDTENVVEESDEENNLSWDTLEPGEQMLYRNFPVASPPRSIANPQPNVPFEVRWDMPSYAQGVEVFEDNQMIYSGSARRITLTRQAGEFTYRIRGRNRCGCGELSDPLVVSVGAENAVMIDCYPNHIDIPWTIEGPDGWTAAGVRDGAWVEMPPGEYTVTFGDVNAWDIEGSSVQTQTLVEGESLSFMGRYGHSIFYYAELFGYAPMHHPSSISGGQVVYSTDGANTLMAYEMSDPRNPQLISSYTFDSEILDFEVAYPGGWVFAGGRVYYVNLMGSISVVGSTEVPESLGTFGDVTSFDGDLFVSNEAGVYQFEVGPGGALTQIGFDTLGANSPIHIHGNTLLFVIPGANVLGGLDASSLGIRGIYYRLDNLIQMETVSSSHIYMLTSDGSFHVANGGSLPASLIAESTFTAPGLTFSDFHVIGDMVYIATSEGMLVLDVSDPSNPVQAGLFQTDEAAFGVDGSGSYAFVGLDGGGTWVVEVAGANSIMVDPDPDDLVAEWTLVKPDGEEINMAGDLLVGSLEPGSYTVNWATIDGLAAPPPVTGELEPGGRLYFYGVYQEVSAADENDLPKTFELGRAYPNPFNPVTKITYALPRDSNVTLKVYDVSGKLVRTLLDNQVQAAGRYTEIWEGRDNKDRRVASGLYFYRINAGSFNAVKKMTLLK